MRRLLAKAGTIGSGNLLARAVSMGLIARAGVLVAGFGASVALARFLGPAGRGLLGVMISVNSLALVVLTFGLPLSVVYHSAQRGADQGALLGNSLLQALLLAAVLVPATALLVHPIAHVFADGRGGRTWILVAVLVPITFLDWTMHGQLQGMLRFGLFTLLLVLSRVVYALAIVILIGGLHLGVAGGVLATAASSLVLIAGSLGPIVRGARVRLDRGLARATSTYGVRVQIGSVFQLTNGRLDVILMGFFRPLSQVGYYVVAQTIAELAITVATAFQSGVLPLLSSTEGEQDRASVSVSSLRHHGILAGVAVLGVAVLGPLVITIAFGARFGPAVAPMLVLLPGIWWLGTGIVVQADLAGRGRPGLSSTLAGLAAVVTVILDVTLIPPLGVYGGAIASVCAYTTFGLSSVIALARITGLPFRELLVPTRAEFRQYRLLLSRASASVRRGRRPATS